MGIFNVHRGVAFDPYVVCGVVLAMALAIAALRVRRNRRSHDLESVPRGSVLSHWLVITATLLMLTAGMFLGFANFSRLAERLTEHSALQEAARYTVAVKAMRKLYTSEVTNRLRGHVEITHDYRDKKAAIPLPTTFTFAFSRELSGHDKDTVMKLYSSHPFPWRVAESKMDAFEREALAKLQQTPDEPFYRFEDLNGRRVIRYAIADVMGKGCVECHNSHPDSPKRDWKEGDVRAAFEVIRPLEAEGAMVRSEMKRSAAFVCAIIAIALAVIGLAFKELRRTSRNLEYTVQELGNARDEAVRLTQLKSEFLANMSHELRTPMNGIIVMSEMVLEGDLAAEHRDCITVVHQSATSLVAIINDILDFSKLEAGKLRIEKIVFKIRDLVRLVEKMCSIHVERRGITLVTYVDPDLPDLLVGDPERLKQILINFLSNAIKFTRDGGSVLLVLTVDRLEGDDVTVTCSVSDTGIGIEASKLDQIFESFQQADGSITRKYGGTGLGLSISRELTALMGGTIGVRSIAGTGSRFSATLPMTRAGDEALARTSGVLEISSSPKSTERTYKILVAEDNEINQKVIERLLTKAGHRVTLVPNGLLALHALETSHFDIVLLDVQMPELDGVGTIRRIRSVDAWYRTIPAIAITAQAMSGDMERILEAGMDGYVSKPIDKGKLFRTMDDAMTISQGRKDPETASQGELTQA